MRCSNCNQYIPDNAKFCPGCGSPIRHPIPIINASPAMTNGQLLGILGGVSGMIGILIFPVVFGPAAIILGVLAVAKRSNIGWIGIVIGSILVIIVGLALLSIFMSDY